MPTQEQQTPKPTKTPSKISIQEFYDAKHYSDGDKRVMEKLYSGETKTVEEWSILIGGKFNELT